MTTRPGGRWTAAAGTASTDLTSLTLVTLEPTAVGLLLLLMAIPFVPQELATMTTTAY